MKDDSLTPSLRLWLLLFGIPCACVAAFVISVGFTVAAFTGSRAAGKRAMQRLGL